MTRGRSGNDVYLVTAGDGDPHNVIRPETVLPPTATDILAGILARDDRQRSASTLTREQACPTTQLRDAVARYHDSLGVIAETVVGADIMTGVDTAGEELRPGLTHSPAYPTLRGHLAILAAGGGDPVAVLAAAVRGRELDTAADPAAVLDWRLNPTGGHGSTRGPLPWLPGIPAALASHERYGPYLSARADLIAAFLVDVREQAFRYTPTSAPPWATHLMDPAHAQLLGDLAVWRASTGVPPEDRRPTGAPQFGAAAARAQHRLNARTAAAQGDPRAPARAWAPLATRLGLDFDHDPYWPELADHLSSLRRTGLDVAGMVTAAMEKPLPDDHSAAALWWRLSRHLPQVGVTDAGRSAVTDPAPLPSGEPPRDPTGVDASQVPTREALEPSQAWHHLATSIDIRLTTDDFWLTLVRAIQEAHDAGYDVVTELPLLAAQGRLSTEIPAIDLAARLRAASQTYYNIEPAIAADHFSSSTSRIASAQKEIRPSSRPPCGPAR